MAGTAEQTDFVHNTDIDPSESYLRTMPRLRLVLQDPALLRAFDKYDRTANARLKLFRRTGMVSLLLGAFSLAGIAIGLFLMALGGPDIKSIFLEGGAALSILIALGPWHTRARDQWLSARFMTEQIRQWHFQMLLDGELVSKAYSTPEAFETERNIRWARFMEQAPTAEGAMSSVADAGTFELHHPMAEYTDLETVSESFRAYSDLRFQKQLHYFRLKREEFAARDEWTESAARWAIFSALILAAMHFSLFVVTAQTGAQMLNPLREDIFLTSALILVIISAVIRVYRSAMAVSPQRERYDTKWVRLIAQKATFEAAPSAERRLEIMREVERIEVEELIEFIRQMRRASYLL